MKLRSIDPILLYTTLKLLTTNHSPNFSNILSLKNLPNVQVLRQGFQDFSSSFASFFKIFEGILRLRTTIKVWGFIHGFLSSMEPKTVLSLLKFQSYILWTICMISCYEFKVLSYMFIERFYIRYEHDFMEDLWWWF